MISLEGWSSTIELYPRGIAFHYQELHEKIHNTLNNKIYYPALPWGNPISSCKRLGMFPFGVPNGGGGWIRTTEAFASDLQSDPFGRSGTPPTRHQIAVATPGPFTEGGILGESILSRNHLQSFSTSTTLGNSAMAEDHSGFARSVSSLIITDNLLTATLSCSRVMTAA
jgi:hypothetical protein